MKLSLPSPLLPCLLSTSSTLSLFIFTFFLLHRFPLLLLQLLLLSRLLPLLLLSRLLLLLLLPRLFPPSSPPPASPLSPPLPAPSPPSPAPSPSPSPPPPTPSPTPSPSQSLSFFCLQHLVRLHTVSGSSEPPHGTRLDTRLPVQGLAILAFPPPATSSAPSGLFQDQP